MIPVEYIWQDGSRPTQMLRSKTRIVHSQAQVGEWSFDGSSTGQATGAESDVLLQPILVVANPVLTGGLLALCETINLDGSPHESNQRSKLVATVERTKDHEPWFGIEQEYTLLNPSGRPLGWPDSGYPAPQGPFYCGVGADNVFGRELVEAHMVACLDAGLLYYGANAEVMPGQWEFQIGTGDPITVADHLHLARWLLFRLGEKFGIGATLHPKPVRGDWNGSGAHTNYSTKSMRGSGGMAVVNATIGRLKSRHDLHIASYGDGIEQRLTGLHETCSYRTFRVGNSDRGASVRIPPATVRDGCGYIEDRRPCANVDPYVVTRLILDTDLETDADEVKGF